MTYHHILFDRHEVVLSEGAATETLFTGEQALKGVGEAARAEILTLFPELRDGLPGKGARQFLTGRQGRSLAEAHGGLALQRDAAEKGAARSLFLRGTAPVSAAQG
ncbi:MAG TPA: Hint domain-containing protein [Paracoccus sp. (in: a-proteobacteria)]|nr:Hint domain-containing protein [Paracoccus sp. (in: a-proteobacteria)]